MTIARCPLQTVVKVCLNVYPRRLQEQRDFYLSIALGM